MKRVLLLCLVVLFASAGLAMGFNQDDVDRLMAGDADMKGADLSGFSFVSYGELQFSHRDFSGADFSGAIMRSREFYDCNLQGADFRGADLRGVKIRSCDLKRADFTGTLLDRVIINACHTEGIKLAGTNMEYVQLVNVDLSGSINNSTIHAGRLISSILLGMDWNTVNFQDASIDSSTIEKSHEQYLKGQSLTLTNITWAAPAGNPVDSIKKTPNNLKKVQPKVPAGAKKLAVPKQ